LNPLPIFLPVRDLVNDLNKKSVALDQESINVDITDVIRDMLVSNFKA